jgi:phenylacetate-coenzyme A ligase PaaK-like adenylate-forming protein
MHLTAAAAANFARTRWGWGCGWGSGWGGSWGGQRRWRWRWRSRASLLAWQERRVREFLRDRLTRAPFYAEIAGRMLAAGRGDIGDITLADLPIVDKQTLLTHFDGFNTRDIRYDDAMAVALAAERSRDFRSQLDDVTVGLSSGTSGQRVPFLVSRRERMLWASSILARMLSTESLARIASPWQPPLHIALFLRANSNLYTTLDSRRVTFTFYDLLQPLDTHVDALMGRFAASGKRSAASSASSALSASSASSASATGSGPHVLVAPATVLRRLADLQLEGRLRLHPRQVISVAETLEQEDAATIARAFDCRVQQIYQATEGFLGYTCQAGTIHLNEECVHIEPEWLDTARTRFHPIVTDFTRETQLIVRYRLDDVLRVRETPCPCGRPSLALAGIDGRRDAVLELPLRDPRRDFDTAASSRRHDSTRAIFPDVMRRAMMLASGDRIRDYRIVQTDDGLIVRLDVAAGCDGFHATARAEAAVRAELDTLFAQQGVIAPPIAFAPWQPEASGDKCCRIRRAASTSSPAPAAASPYAFPSAAPVSSAASTTPSSSKAIA